MAAKPRPPPEPVMRGKDVRRDASPQDLAQAVLRGGVPRRRDPSPPAEDQKDA